MPSSSSSASNPEFDLSRVPSGLAASLRGEIPEGPETEPRCLAEAFNKPRQFSKALSRQISGITHLGPMEHANIEIPKTQAAVVTNASKAIIALVTSPKIKC